MAQIVPVLALLFSTAFLLAGNGMHRLLLPLRGTAEGFSTGQLGLIGTGWATGFILGCLTAPIVVRRVGHIRAFACSAACASIIILLNALFVVPIAWILLRVGSGFFIAGAFMIIESWLNERAANESRGTIFAIYMMVTYFGITAGQLGVGAGDPRTSTLFIVGAILFSLAILPTALSTAASPRPLTRVTIDLRKLFSELAGRVPLGAPRRRRQRRLRHARRRVGRADRARDSAHRADDGHHRRLRRADAAAGRPHLRQDRPPLRDRRHSALGAALAGLAIVVAQARRTHHLVLTLVALYGAITYPIYGLAVAHANDYADASEFVAVSGGLLLLYGAGTMFGPLAASAAMSAIGPEAIFLVTATSHVAIAGYALLPHLRRPPIPGNVREAFMTVPSSRAMTPETAALDPRAEDATVLDETQMRALDARIGV